MNDGGDDGLHRTPLVAGKTKFMQAFLDDLVPLDVELCVQVGERWQTQIAVLTFAATEIELIDPFFGF